MQKHQFFSALNQCLTQDRPRFISRWQRLRTTPADKKSAAIAQLQQQLQQSQQAVAQRQQALPAVTLNEDLPVSQRAQEIIDAIQQHQVVVLAGETGSGKTTQLPKLCLLAGRGVYGFIGHTQPRRLAARSVAARIAEELNSPLGEVVGYKVRFNEACKAESYIKLMTDGILLAELANDRYLNAYDTLIIDEAHERSLNIDFLLGYLRQLLAKRPDLKVIITSATLDVERFSRHFNNAPIIQVEGRTFPVEVRYRPMAEESVQSDEDEGFEQLEEAMPRAVVNAVEECIDHSRQQGRAGSGDILVFASTEREIRDLADTLRKYGPPHTEILPLYARLSLNEQQRIFHPTGKGRRIIIATNVAETSLTVPNIHYVIDNGFARISRYSYRSRVQRLPIEAVAQAAANQRKGRCGRIAAGVCIRLYSEEDFNSRPEFTEPEIRRTHLAAVILQMNVLGLGNISEFPFIEPPDSRFINDGVRVLEELGALDKQQKITSLGQQLSRFPLDPRLARMLVAAAHSACLDEVLIIVSALGSQDPRERPPEKQMQADQKHALFKDKDSDFLFYVKLWRAFEEVRTDLSENQRKQWIKSHFLSYLRMREWRETHHQLVLVCKDIGLQRNSEPATYEVLHRALLTGLLSSIAHKNDDKEYLAARNQKAKVFPASALYKKPVPWLMAAEIVETSQVFLRTNAKIEPEWIEQEAKHLLKHHVYEPHWEKNAGKVMAYEQLSLFGLVINPKRKLNYETINAKESHEIFIRRALVEGEINLKAPFFSHNMKLVQDIIDLEDKLRRRDILVDDEVLYQFYANIIPEHIANVRTFEGWRREAERQNPQILFCQPEALMTQEGEACHQQYPDNIALNGLVLPLRYKFDPSVDDDGVTISIPHAVLTQLDDALLSWLIPSLLADKVEALLKALPKAIRRQLVPVPDTVKSLLSQLPESRQQSLTQVLGGLLQRRGVTINAADWQEAENNLPFHCRFYIEVIDNKGKVLKTGRDLSTLKIQLSSQKVELAVNNQQILTSFPEHIEPVVEKTVAGLPTRSYAALVKQEQGVTLQYLANQHLAHTQHQRGCLYLWQLHCATELKQFKKSIPNALVLDYSGFGNKAQLEQQLVDALCWQVFGEQLVYSQVDFDKILTSKRGQLLTMGQQLIKTVANIYQLWRAINQQICLYGQAVFAQAIADINLQLTNLQAQSFLSEIAPQRWQEYPRYLKGLQLRLERLTNNIQRDNQASQELHKRWQQYQQKVADFTARSVNIQPLHDYRWLLEEYRISLFSQPMKTALPVSKERLDKQFAALV
ncbi:MAG: ATP-dependent RNA helicase HrpA [Moraxellaceae bacterium]|nr:ATP-dependent RNA helicase HrpA [Moraxellaceae bacterium]